MAGTRTPFSVAEVKWQDYRAAQTGMVVYYTSDPVSEIPIREIPEDLDSPVPPDPHYETGTYGLYACARPKVRAAFMKNKVRWLFFVTKYEGTNADFRGKYLVTGVYHVARTADARRFHIRHCKEYECLEVGTCLAFLADTVHFVGLSDAFEVTPEALKDWNYSAKVNRQTRIILDAVHTKTLLEYLQSKPDALKAYLDETRRLQPHGAEEEAEEEFEEPSVEPAPVETTESPSAEPEAPPVAEEEPAPEEPTTAVPPSNLQETAATEEPVAEAAPVEEPAVSVGEPATEPAAEPVEAEQIQEQSSGATGEAADEPQQQMPEGPVAS